MGIGLQNDVRPIVHHSNEQIYPVEDVTAIVGHIRNLCGYRVRDKHRDPVPSQHQKALRPAHDGYAADQRLDPFHILQEQGQEIPLRVRV